MAAHKLLSAILVIIIVGGLYYWIRHAATASAEPQYVLSVAHVGTLQQTVTGTGQVSASNQTDIPAQVSGTIESIDVKVGQHVAAGQLIATIDPTNAALALKNAQISLAKLIQPPKATDISNANANLDKDYNNGFNAASTIYLDLPNIVAGMKSLFYDQSGFLTDQQSSYLTPTARDMRMNAGKEYDNAVVEYQTALAEFQSLTRDSATTSLDKMMADTAAMQTDMAKAVSDAQNVIAYVTTYQPDYDPKGATTAATNISSWSSQANSDLSALISAQNSIQTDQNALTTLVNGADQYDVQASELAVQQAQQAYDNYFIRAPYAGLVGRIPVNVFSQASNGTVMATIIGDQNVADISLNEVDAAKVKAGQPVLVTFDAISGLDATGTVEEVDQVGTVTQGVVSYGVKIAINTQDSQIKPGMSVNVTIIVNQEDGVLLVPNSAIKTQGNTKYVQVLDQATVEAALNAMRGGAAGGTAGAGGSASSTRRFGQFGSTSPSQQALGSTTSYGTSTPSRGNSGPYGANRGNFILTISTSAAPQQVAVTTGDSDDTNTVILSGLTRGQFVITRTISSGSSGASSAPSIFSSIGARAGGNAGGGNRAFIRPGGGG